MSHPQRLREFLARFSALIDSSPHDEDRLLTNGGQLLHSLVSHDDWLPDAFAQVSLDGYRQYLLYCDPSERYSVVSFVWGPGQHTPVHDHTVWGLIGVLRGAEQCEEYEQPQRFDEPMISSGMHRLDSGQVDKVSPRIGDVHAVSNALTDRASISIHVYGANIGAVQRHVFDPQTGRSRPFVSGYHNTVLPNVWSQASEVTTAAGNVR